MSRSEAAIQAASRMRASALGWRVWRNNVGAFTDEHGNVIRFGLANDSAQTNKRIKSSDLIGIRPVLITPAHVGTTIGQFVSIECKAEDWVWRPSDMRAEAQMRWLELIAQLGGHAAMVTHEGQL